MRSNLRVTLGIVATLLMLALLMPQTLLAATGVTTVRLTCNQAYQLPQGSTVQRSATVMAGTILKVALCEYGSDGGFGWVDPKYDSNLLNLLSTKHKPSSGQIGSPGTEIWRFDALSPSTSTITFVDRRSFGGHQKLLKVVVAVHITA